MIKLNIPLYLVKFIKNFLNNRSFKVKVNEAVSNSYPVTCSVPQGSVLGPLLFLIFIGDIPLSNTKNISYSALFADDLSAIFCFNKPGKIKYKIKFYLENLVKWLFKWRLKMNASKCCYTIFSGSGGKGVHFDLQLNGDPIPYQPNPVFLGITFDENLCFNTHYSNLRVRALKRLNIIKIFSHKSWHLNYKTLTNIYRALIGSIFDYSFFTVSCVSNTCLNLIQKIQNRALRCIYKLNWDSPTKELFTISGVLSLKIRFLQLGARYLIKCIYFNNKLIKNLLIEYFHSWSAITARNKKMTTPLCPLTLQVALAYTYMVFVNLFALCLKLKLI